VFKLHFFARNKLKACGLPTATLQQKRELIKAPARPKMNSLTSDGLWTHLPVDIVVIILDWKTIFLCKRVCKKWCNYLSQEIFLLHISKQTNIPLGNWPEFLTTSIHNSKRFLERIDFYFKCGK
jgi:hypothetical protein